MTARAEFAFVQARLGARHGARPSGADWQSLQASRSLALYLERARHTALARFTQLVQPHLDAHAIERLLRAGWRDYLAEIAGWIGAAWQPAVRWLGLLPELTVLDHLRRGGEAPAWLARDNEFNRLLPTARESRADALSRAGYAALGDQREALAALWLIELSRRWPPAARDDFTRLAAALQRVARLLSGSTGSLPLAARLAAAEQQLTHLFRRHGGTPLALFAHLGLVLLDLLRLRADLLRRSLFHDASAEVSS